MYGSVKVYKYPGFTAAVTGGRYQAHREFPQRPELSMYAFASTAQGLRRKVLRRWGVDIPARCLKGGKPLELPSVGNYFYLGEFDV